MNDRNREIIVNFFIGILDVYEFSLETENDSKSENLFKLNDMQGGNLGGIEQERFNSLGDILERMDVYHNDYIYRSLEEREDAHEEIAKDDWDLTAKRFLLSDTVEKILSDTNVKKYLEIINNKKDYDIKEMIEILDEDEKFYKSVCEKYVNTMSKEMLLEIDDKILHIYIEDEFIRLKEDGKINNQNYKEYLDGNFEVEEYRFYQELYENTIRDNVAYDLNDLELFDENGKWNFYITFEELKRIGYSFMVKDQYPLIEKYAVSEDKIFEFFDYFSLEQLDDFENTLNQYFIENTIEYDGENLFSCKEDYTFNTDILRLACGLITYEDFIKDYTIKEPSNYDLISSKVSNYFGKKGMEDLMEYGSDSDEGLYHLSTLYKDLMEELNIKFEDIYTEDFSAGKYITTIIFRDNLEIKIDTSAFNGIEVVTDNLISVLENYNEKNIQNDLENENDLDYDYA